MAEHTMKMQDLMRAKFHGDPDAVCPEDGADFDAHYDTGFEDGMRFAHTPEFTDLNVFGQEAPVGVSVRCVCGWGPDHATLSRFTAEIAYVQHVREVAQGYIPADFTTVL